MSHSHKAYRRDSWTTPYERVPAPPDDEGRTPCASCGEPVGALEVFPGGICLDCYAASPDGRRMPTADELVRMWGGPARRR